MSWTSSGVEGVEINWAENKIRWKTEGLEENIYAVFGALRRLLDIRVLTGSIKEEDGYFVAEFVKEGD